MTRFACHKCFEVGHFRKQCKAKAQRSLKTGFFKKDKVVEDRVAEKEESKVMEESKVEEEVKEEEKAICCKWCGEVTHATKMCRRYKTRLCDFDECKGPECPYAHSAAELRSTIWFHTELCTLLEHTSECRRTYAHSEEERYNALSALTAVHMIADLL